jgi:adenine phosphoribosyltransferase
MNFEESPDAFTKSLSGAVSDNEDGYMGNFVDNAFDNNQDLTKDIEIFLKDKMPEIQNRLDIGMISASVSQLFEDGEIFSKVVFALSQKTNILQFEKIIGIDVGGFAIGAALASYMKKGFVMIRKKGELSGKTTVIDYELEYGTEALELQNNSINEGMKYLIVGDILSTGKTASVAKELVNKLGGIVAGFGFLIEVEEFQGKEILEDSEIISLIKY